VLPAPAAVVGARDDSLDPRIEAQAAGDGRLSGDRGGRLAVPDVVVVGQDGGDGRVEDGQQAQRGADAVGAVPERRGGEKVRGQEREVVGVAQGGEERRRGAEDARAVSTGESLLGVRVRGRRYRGVSSWSE